ncbi:3-hydroxyisobutyrate dehydrogenase/2-hydroxy-3-oxopropionate reductase [Tumebacillus sp. BK434]|uniref:NAD(P)-dependent oxidoreductase n=1 Tax=Tumebacillus sp. BK434 TaxID=2512169 RepID=UPI00104876DF|nr:NAD(P)-dependent oxidoreductase [Tumebacillus sp. BK434]TCP52532.1 3-hydroxyisobutyrate dehydrogenase/2-hydroxy-3-oxopropionate reductase [Tumebacillus sp. BK434]
MTKHKINTEPHVYLENGADHQGAPAGADDEQAERPTVTVLGAGMMGKGMIHNLQQAGFPLRLYNRTLQTLHGLATEQDVICATPCEAAQGAEVILSVITDDAAHQAVWFGPQGAIHGAAAGAVGLECSTLSVPCIEAWRDALHERGLIPIDSPTTGNRAGAEAGTLNLFLGGDPDAITAIRPVLAAISCQQFHFGPTGSGTRFKLLYNLFTGTMLVALGEAVGMAQTFGLDLQQVVDTMEATGFAIRNLKDKGQKMIDGRHDEVFSKLSILHKDMACAIQSADPQASFPVGEQAAERLRQAVHSGFGSLDVSATSLLYLPDSRFKKIVSIPKKRMPL